MTAGHTYAVAGTYPATLTVTDDGGATASESQAVVLISLTARGYKVKGIQKVDLSWSGSSAASFDLFRNRMKITTVSTTAYTDTVGKGPGTYTYKVCEARSATCSNEASVSF